MAKKSEDRHYGGRGDPARSIALLWRDRSAPASSRGPRPGLTVDKIAAAAIDLADAEGLAALSMRRVAERLGVGTMSLYTYVPSKAELVDVMFDMVCGEVGAEISAEDAPGGWRERLAWTARANWDLYRRHPWMLQVMAMARPPLGPNAIAGYDRDLRAVDGVGLTDLEMDSVVSLVAVYVQGAARTAIDAAGSERDTGISDEEWWEAYGPLLDKVFDPRRYPLAARVGAAAGEAYQAAYDPEHGFEFGLERVLDGVEALVRSRQKRQ